MKSEKFRFSLCVAACLLTVWLLFLRGSGSTVPTAELGRLPAELEQVRLQAFELQQQREWRPAQEKWRELIDKLSEHPEYVTAADEAQAYLKIAQQRCDPSQEMVEPGESIEVDHRTEDQPTITGQSLLSHYPRGKTIRSVTLLTATGRGSNQKWVFRSDANFAYESYFSVENKVLANTGSMAKFEVSIPLTAQNLVVSDKTIKLERPKSPIIHILWDEADRNLRGLPPYHVARRITDLVHAVDPDLKRLLTSFYKRLKIAGYDLDPNSEELQLKAIIDAFSGHRLRLVYAPGYGVQAIEILEGEPLPKKDLIEFARNGGLLMDYVLSDVLKIQVGETFEVDAPNIVRMIGMNYDVDVQGTIVLQREADEDGLAVMSVVEGEVVVEATVEGVRRRGTLTPKASGYAKFNRASLFVTQAQLEWHADLDWFTENHLLFGTRAVRDLDMRSYYEAELVKE